MVFERLDKKAPTPPKYLFGSTFKNDIVSSLSQLNSFTHPLPYSAPTASQRWQADTQAERTKKKERKTVWLAYSPELIDHEESFSQMKVLSIFLDEHSLLNCIV